MKKTVAFYCQFFLFCLCPRENGLTLSSSYRTLLILKRPPKRKRIAHLISWISLKFCSLSLALSNIQNGYHKEWRGERGSTVQFLSRERDEMKMKRSICMIINERCRDSSWLSNIKEYASFCLLCSLFPLFSPSLELIICSLLNFHAAHMSLHCSWRKAGKQGKMEKYDGNEYENAKNVRKSGDVRARLKRKSGFDESIFRLAAIFWKRKSLCPLAKIYIYIIYFSKLFSKT